MKLAVGFILYNENTSRYLPDFLPSLFRALALRPAADYRIYAFDNSFADNPVNKDLLSKFPAIEYQTRGVNLGYGRAYNILINAASRDGAEYFLLINPDSLLDERSIEKLLAVLESDGSLAAAAPKIFRWDFARRAKTNILDSAGLILKPGLRFLDLGQGQTDKGQFDQAAIIGPSGAAGLFRLSALRAIAEKTESGQPEYFDERFFMYKEDCDLAYRLFLSGGSTRLVPDSLIYHDRTAASSGLGLLSRWRDRQSKSRQVRAWSFRNQHLIFVKHWKKQNLANKALVAGQILFYLLFSLILEQFLLKEYPYIFRWWGLLTNIK
jgi:GT2 family glycosyltransferase